MTCSLIKYHHKTGAVEMQTLAEARTAMRARILLERSAAIDEEGVVLSSDSEAMLRIMHARCDWQGTGPPKPPAHPAQLARKDWSR